MSDLRDTLSVEMSNRGISPVLIGRATEIAALAEMLRAIRQGGPATLLIGGEAGVGKTRLLQEFFPNEPCRLLTGPCLELGADGLPFGPFTAMLRDLVKETGADEVIAMLPGGSRATRELARLLPELTGGEPSGRGDDDGSSGGDRGGSEIRGAGEARARLFEEFLTLLERLAEQQPVAVVIEDAHWADRSSRDLLTFLVRYQRSLPGVAIVVTFRSDELHRTHPLRPLLAELSRIDWVDRIDLPRLTWRQAGELAAAILGREPGNELADVLYTRAEGNPLFTEELLAASDGGYEMPGSLADLLLRAVRRLPAETQEVLRVVSASTGVVGPGLLTAVTGQGADELAQALRPAVTGNVLVTTADGYAFRHELIREAVYEDLLPGEPGRIHEQYALAIGEDPSLVPPGRADVVMAHHWDAAHVATWALISAWQAARQAGRSIAHAERLTLVARVLNLWGQVPDAAERIGADRTRVFEEAVAAAWDAGEDQRGLAFTAAAIAELDEATEPVRVADLLLRQANFKQSVGRPGSLEDIAHALRLVPESLATQDETYSHAWQTRMTALIESAATAYDWSEPRVKQWLDEVLRFARKAGDLEAEARALLLLALARSSPGWLARPDSEPMRLVAQARAVAQRADAPYEILRAAIYESHLLGGAGDYERSIEVARQGVADAARYGLARRSGAFTAMNVAEPLFALGRWDEALDVTEQTLELAPSPRARAMLGYFTGSIALARGDYVTASAMLAAGRPVLYGVQYDDQHHPALGGLETGLKQATEGAAEAVATAAGLLERFDLSVSGPRYVWPFLVTAAFAAAEAMEAEAETAAAGVGAAAAGVGAAPAGAAAAGAALLDRLRSAAEKTAVFGPVQEAWRLTFTAITTSAAGTGAAGTGATGSLAAWDATAAAWEVLHQPQQTATALFHAARAALRLSEARERREAVADRLRRAAPLAEELRARPLSEQIADLARRTGVSLTAGETAPERTSQAGLTSRESEVLRLLATGRSNREIAAALFISPKTASVHVSNILGKLGAANRTEVADRARSLRLLELSFDLLL
jgi:DNA-binding NarL/FixJ family response regulator/tetratricopeptide (TPR) repeat protein